MDEREALHVLNCFPGMSAGLLRRIWEHCGSFEEALKETGITLRYAGVLKDNSYVEKYDAGLKELTLHRRDYEKLMRSGVSMVCCWEPEFPERLKVIPDPPVLLYVRGNLPEEDVPAAAIIGARNCSEYGRMTAEYFGKELAAAGVAVISGMAGGIDSAAQRGALRAAGISYGVLGSGVNVCYPKESEDIYVRMCRGEGGVISEYPPYDKPIGYHFVCRNRIIAGMSDVLAVVEAKIKSGTSITINACLDQGKDVFALPGRIDDPLGKGCNQLIRDGAFIMTEPEDILRYLEELKGSGRRIGQPEIMKQKILEAERRETEREKERGRGILKGSIRNKARDDGHMAGFHKKITDSLSAEELQLRGLLSMEDMHIEEIADRLSMSLGRTIQCLAEMERKGIVASESNGYYHAVYDR